VTPFINDHSRQNRSLLSMCTKSASIVNLHTILSCGPPDLISEESLDILTSSFSATSHLEKTSLDTQQRSCLQRTAIFLQIPRFSFGKECELCAHRCYLSAWQIIIIWIQILRSTKPQYIIIYCLFQKNGLYNFLHTECTFKVT